LVEEIGHTGEEAPRLTWCRAEAQPDHRTALPLLRLPQGIIEPTGGMRIPLELPGTESLIVTSLLSLDASLVVT
jgi:hypothetical protein